jgi:hypothetical protein
MVVRFPKNARRRYSASAFRPNRAKKAALHLVLRNSGSRASVEFDRVMTHRACAIVLQKLKGAHHG